MFTTPFAFMAQAGEAPPPENLLLYLDAASSTSYPGSGDTWFDLSGNSKDADLYGSPTFVSSGRTSYFQFQGVTGGEYAEIPGFALENLTSLEIMLSWYGPISGGSGVDRMWSTGPNDNFELGVNASGQISIYPGSGWQYNVTSFGGVGICRHFVFTLDGTTIKIYRDGIFIISLSLSSAITPGVDTYIARRYIAELGPEGTDIDVKYIKVHNEVLSAGQVAAAYALNSDRC